MMNPSCKIRVQCEHFLLVYIQFIRSYESLSVRNMGDSGEQLARLEGYYKVVGHRAQFLRVEGNTATLKDTHETFVLSTTISYGEFGKD